MTTGISIIAPSEDLTNFDKMANAIAMCASVDECTTWANKAHAMAEYAKQARDTETERNFRLVKMRAWRRIGQLCMTVDLSKNPYKGTAYKKYQFIKENVPGGDVLTFNEVSQAIEIASLSDDDFEAVVRGEKNPSLYTVSQSAHWLSAERNEEINSNVGIVRRPRGTEGYRFFDATDESARVATVEETRPVGYSLNLKPKRPMTKIIVIMASESHDAIRKAAFDERITMNHLIRQAIDLWFEKQGLNPPFKDIQASNNFDFETTI